MAFKMKNPSMAKLTKAAGDNRVAMKMKMEEKAAAKMKQEAAMKMKKESMAKLKEEAAMKMKRESAMKKPLVGDQDKLNEGLKKAIKAAPSKMKEDSSMKMSHKSANKMKEDSAMKLDREKPRKEGGKGALRDIPRKVPKKIGSKKDLKPRKPGKKVESAVKQKMNMVKGPDGKMVPDFAVDGKGANDMKSGAKMKDNSPVKKTYREAWEAMKSYETKEGNRDEKKTKSGIVYSDDEKGYQKFVRDAKAYNLKKYGTTEPTKAAKKFTGGDKKELEKLAKPKKIASREGGEKGNKLAKVTTPRKPSKADQITAIKREGGRGARKIAAAERKMRKAAGDTSKRGDRKRRKAAKKLGKAGVESPMTMVKAVSKEQKVTKIQPTQKPNVKNTNLKPMKQTVKKLTKPKVTAKF